MNRHILSCNLSLSIHRITPSIPSSLRVGEVYKISTNVANTSNETLTIVCAFMVDHLVDLRDEATGLPFPNKLKGILTLHFYSCSFKYLIVKGFEVTLEGGSSRSIHLWIEAKAFGSASIEIVSSLLQTGHTGLSQWPDRFALSLIIILIFFETIEKCSCEFIS